MVPNLLLSTSIAKLFLQPFLASSSAISFPSIPLCALILIISISNDLILMIVMISLINDLLLIPNHFLFEVIFLAVVKPSIAACESVLIFSLVLDGHARTKDQIAVNSALVDDGHLSTFPLKEILGIVKEVQPKPINVFSALLLIIRDPSV